MNLDEFLKQLPAPIAATWGGLDPGGIPYVELRYPVDSNNDALAVLANRALNRDTK